MADTPKPDLMSWCCEIDLPLVGGEPTIKSADIYDDAVEVWVEHGSYGQPCATLRFCPTGPSEFNILGFDPAGLRKLARFLESAADNIEHETKIQTARYET